MQPNLAYAVWPSVMSTGMHHNFPTTPTFCRATAVMSYVWPGSLYAQTVRLKGLRACCRLCCTLETRHTWHGVPTHTLSSVAVLLKPKTRFTSEQSSS